MAKSKLVKKSVEQDAKPALKKESAEVKQESCVAGGTTRGYRK